MTTDNRAATSPTIAVVVPCFNEQESVTPAVKELRSILESLAEHDVVSRDSFVLFVDDGSTDGTWPTIEEHHRTTRLVRGLKLSRNFGHQNALLAGLMEVRGSCDAAVSLDADLQQDPGAIPAFVDAFKRGFDVVLGVRKDRKSDGPLKRYSALGFYSVMNLMGVDAIPNHADYRLLSARALDALALFEEPNIFLRATCMRLGFRVTTISFDVRDRQFGVTKYSLHKMSRLAIHGITSFSVTPLRIVAIIGVLLFFMSAAMGIYVAWRALVVGDTVPGWASTALPIYFIGGVQLLCLGVVGEYVGQIYTTVKHRPRWICENRLG